MEARYTDSVDMMALLNSIGPLNRTLASNETDHALEIVQGYLDDSRLFGVPCGSSVWGWKVPYRWEVEKATISANGKVLVDVAWHPLHLVNYSESFKGKVSKEELLKHLYTDKNNPDAIPFVFSFYESRWGFCIPHTWLGRFDADEFDVDIEVRFEEGEMNVLECFLPGDSQETILLCNNICHPAQVNDSLTGLAASVDIFERMRRRERRKYSYRLLIVPETVGSIAYLAHRPDVIEDSVFGIVSEMLGTDGQLVGQRSRSGGEYLNYVMGQAIEELGLKHKLVDFLRSAGNDEKVMDSQGVDIPTISITRYPYKEYHTSNDNVSLISVDRLREGRDALQLIIDYLERDFIPSMKHPGPVFLSGNDLYPDWRNDQRLAKYWESFLDVMYGIDTSSSVIEIAMRKGIPLESCFYWLDAFVEKGLALKNPYSFR